MVTGDTSFFASVLSIIVIDITLAGDNAVVIAMAARRLPHDKRRKAIAYGALAAIVVRVVLTFFVSQVLQVQLVKLIGGLVILWVGMKLFSPGESTKETAVASNIWEAVKIIVIADISMGVDNMLAVGGASEGHLGLLLFGLGFSIPFLVFASDFLSRAMDRFPVILYVGAAILGRVAGNMIMTDPTTVSWLAPSRAVVYAVEALLAVAIVVAGLLLQRRRRRVAAEHVDAQDHERPHDGHGLHPEEVLDLTRLTPGDGEELDAAGFTTAHRPARPTAVPPDELRSTRGRDS